jgi:hypothetical protein
MGAREFPIRLNVPNRLVYSPHEYPASMYPQSWFYDRNYPDNLPSVWEQYWGYLAADQPILIGEFGTRLETDKDRQWLEKFRSYIQAKRLNWTFWSLNPNSGDTGGLLRDDWVSVHQEKQDLLKTIQYPSIDGGSRPFPTTLVPGQTPTVMVHPWFQLRFRLLPAHHPRTHLPLYWMILNLAAFKVGAPSSPAIRERPVISPRPGNQATMP